MKVYIASTIAITQLISNVELKNWTLFVAGSNKWENYHQQVREMIFLVHYKDSHDEVILEVAFLTKFANFVKSTPKSLFHIGDFVTEIFQKT